MLIFWQIYMEEMLFPLDIPRIAWYNRHINKRGSPRERIITMYMTENKYTSPAEYFYNEYIEMYCVIGTTISTEDLDDLIELFETPDLLTEVEMPEYITEDYDYVW